MHIWQCKYSTNNCANIYGNICGAKNSANIIVNFSASICGNNCGAKKPVKICAIFGSNYFAVQILPQKNKSPLPGILNFRKAMAGEFTLITAPRFVRFPLVVPLPKLCI